MVSRSDFRSGWDTEDLNQNIKVSDVNEKVILKKYDDTKAAKYKFLESCHAEILCIIIF